MSSDPDKAFLEEYLLDVHSRLTAMGDESELLARAQAGDTEALDELVASYLELTALITIRLVRTGFPLRVALQEANAGLVGLLKDQATVKPVLTLAAVVDDALRRIGAR